MLTNCDFRIFALMHLQSLYLYIYIYIYEFKLWISSITPTLPHRHSSDSILVFFLPFHSSFSFWVHFFDRPFVSLLLVSFPPPIPSIFLKLCPFSSLLCSLVLIHTHNSFSLCNWLPNLYAVSQPGRWTVCLDMLGISEPKSK